MTRIFIFRKAIEQGEPPISVIDDTGFVRQAWAVKLHGPSEIIWSETGFFLEELEGRPHVRVWVETADRVTIDP